MHGTAPGSPKTKGVHDLKARIKRLERFEKWGRIEPLPLRDLVGEKNWDAYWADLDVIMEKMFEAQAHGARVRVLVQKALEERSKLTKAS